MSTIKSSDEHLTLNADGTSKDIKLQSNASEKVIVKSTGNVGINNSAPTQRLEINGNSQLNAYDNPSGSGGYYTTKGMQIGNAFDAGLSGGDDDRNAIVWNERGTSLLLGTNNTERMRIDYNGDVFVGTTSSFANSSTRLEVISESAGLDCLACKVLGTNQNAISFYQNGYSSPRGSITVGTSSVAYNTSSDYRLKENVDYTWDATTRLKQLKPARFNFIADDTNTLVDGFIAHEVSSVVPEAVSGEKDAMIAEVLYAEGDDIPEGKSVGDVKTAAAIDPQGIDQSKLVPLLVKTIQELEARITELENA